MYVFKMRATLNFKCNFSPFAKIKANFEIALCCISTCSLGYSKDVLRVHSLLLKKFEIIQ